MGREKDKRVPARALPQLKDKGGKRVVVAEESGSYYGKHPSWRFGRMLRDKVSGDGSFLGFESMQEDAGMVYPKLRDFDCSTWKDIILNKNAHEKHHTVKVYNLADGPRKYIQSIEPGLEEIMSFRFTGTHRLFGKVTKDGVFEALMWDREHKVYPMSHQRH